MEETVLKDAEETALEKTVFKIRDAEPWEEKEAPEEKEDHDRRSGVLLPVFSLPSPCGIGDMGQEAYDFIDLLAAAGASYWQVLPVGPTGSGNSPYYSYSTFAGNPMLIDLRELAREGLLGWEDLSGYWGDDPSRIDYPLVQERRISLLRKAFAAHEIREEDSGETEAFRREMEEWLSDYALYMAIRTASGDRGPDAWDEPLRLRKPEALEKARRILSREMDFWVFVQEVFFRQWRRLRAYANEKGIRIIGDMPIYVSDESVDVWARPGEFLLDENFRPTVVAGVPPDLFSDSGQRWGNPLYNWKKMKEDGYSWWKARIRAASRLYDVLRIDHFIGMVRYYAIPADAPDGRVGDYYRGPGDELLKELVEAAGEMKIIAEDLGVVVPEVTALRHKYGMPGMTVLEFAFDGTPVHPFLPPFHDRDTVIYLGTHDNDTLRGFLESCPRPIFEWIREYLGGTDVGTVAERMVRTAFMSVARTCIIQAQDLLFLSGEARINLPGTAEGNWNWRLRPGQMTDHERWWLGHLTWVYGRSTRDEMI